jgi:PAS domain S-box-containing protein/diguanylate cyclase (GGDEF)-like protein
MSHVDTVVRFGPLRAWLANGHDLNARGTDLMTSERPGGHGAEGNRSRAESARAEALSSYGILDTGPEPMFDDLASLAARICGTPMAGITIVTPDRVWFKARLGLELAEAPRELSICTWAVDADDGVFVVEDIATDRRFCHNQLIADSGIRFYAGAPIHSSEGIGLGAVCVMDNVPHQLSADKSEALLELARQTEVFLAARRTAREVAALISRREKAARDEALREVAHSETRFAVAFGGSPIGMIMADLDATILEVNEAFASMVGYSVDELVGRDARTLRAADETIDEDLLLAELLAGTCDRVVREKRFVHRDGQHVAAVSTGVLVQGGNRAPHGLLWHVESIDDQRRAEDALLETQSVHDAIMTLDSKERVVAWNAGAERTFGWSRTEMLGQAARLLLPGRLRARYDVGPGVTGPSIFEHMEIGGSVTEVVAQHKDGHEFPVEVSHSLWQRQGQQWIIVITRDITERVALQAELLAQANTDPLTGAPTRGAFTRQLASLLTVSAPVSVIVFNLVRFAQLNMSLGPASGDQVLIEVGRRLQGALRPGDTYGRLDGDGFAVVLPGTTGTAALKIAGRLRAAIHDRPVAGPWVLAVIATN